MDNNKILDKLVAIADVANDAQLASLMGLSRGTISRIRKGERAFGAEVVLAAYEKLGVPIETIRRWQADPDEAE